TVHFVLMELAFKSLSICQVKLPFAFLVVLVEVSFVLHPVLLNISPISVVEGVPERGYIFVVEGAIPRKLIVFPFPFVGDLLVRIVENAFAMHFVLLPIPNILATFAVVESASAMSLPIELGALVVPPVVLLAHMHQL